jgi:GNAT superfamily N-acetyltransferase
MGFFKHTMAGLIRTWLNSRRPSKDANLRAMQERGESIQSLVFRDISFADLDALVKLHVKAWADTYPMVKQPPTYAIRKYQWEEQFLKSSDSWFCIVIENKRGELIGFAKGILFKGPIPGFEGELSKIYLLEPYQRMGLGTTLIKLAAQRFLSMGIGSMLLFSEIENPSIYFYERLGGEKVNKPHGKFEGTYGWRDLHVLAETVTVS